MIRGTNKNIGKKGKKKRWPNVISKSWTSFNLQEKVKHSKSGVNVYNGSQ